MAEIGKVIGRGRSAEIYALGTDRVIKLFLEGTPLSLVDREFEASTLVAQAGLPVPGVLGRMEILFRPGIVYQRVRGRLLSRDILLTPWKLRQHFIRLAELHSDIHSIAIESLPEQLGNLIRIINNLDALSPEHRLELIALLEALPRGEDKLCHGDFHPENVMVTPGGSVVLDWMNAVRGNSLADVARTVLILRLYLPRPIQGGISIYLNRYRQILSFSESEFRVWFRIVAAARLAEQIPREQTKLMAWMNQA